MDDLARYHRQMLLPDFGEAGQRKIRAASVLLVGCGALGCSVADMLVRAGIGRLVIVDRDVVELTNLQRQVLFDEDDAREGAPKAVAAARRLGQINRDVVIEPHVEDFTARNAERLLDGDCSIIIDGLDNFETRYLLNDLAVKHGRAYIYGGAVGTTGMMLALRPNEGPCLRCVFPEAPPAGSEATCDTAGVLGPVIQMVTAWQVTAALRIILGVFDEADLMLRSIDLWSGEQRAFDVSEARGADCPCCGAWRFDYLEDQRTSTATTLCGRGAVQITPASSATADLEALAQRLRAHGDFTINEHLLRGGLHHETGAEGEAIEVTVFRDGRIVVRGVDEPERARGIVAKYIGG